MEKKKRFCTLSSAIMSVLGMVVFAIMCLTLNTDFRDGAMYLIFGLMVATILLNIGCFVKWSTTKIKYKKFLWYLIITLIVEFALVFFSLFLTFAEMITIEYKLVWFTTGLIYLVVFALLLTDVVIGAKYKYDKEKKERKSRPFTLSASIVSTIVGAAVFGIMLYVVIALAQYGFAGYTPFIVWVNLISSLGVLGLGIPTICLANSSAEKYKKAIGLFITAFVFSCLQVVLSLIYICVAGVNTIVGAISLIAMLGCAVSGTLYMLDIARKNKAQQQTKVVRQQEVQQTETPKPATEKKSRPFTLSASIVSTIVGAAVFGIMLYIIIALAQYGAVGYTPFIVWVNLISSLGVLGLGIPTIWLANSSAEKYKKAIGLFITAFVFSCLQVVLSLIYICVAGVSTIVGAISLIAMLGCAVSGTLYMLDIARKNKAQQQTKAVRQQEVQQAETPKPAAEKSLVQSLQEIKEMKEMGLINDEDYEKLKSNILSNYKF